jgi:hypothetical protein
MSRWRWHRDGSSSLQSKAMRWLRAPPRTRSDSLLERGTRGQPVVAHVALLVVELFASRAPPELCAQGHIVDTAFGQCFAEPFRVEVRHVAGPGHGAHVGDGLDAVLPEQPQESIEDLVRMADRQHARSVVWHGRCRQAGGALVASAMACSQCWRYWG